MPIFGYGAKTFPGSSETSHIFPMSMNMSNPLIPNQADILQDQYAKCLSELKMHVPVRLTPTLKFLKNLAIFVRENQEKIQQ